MVFKDSKWYQVCKWAVTVGLPAVTTLWLTLSSIWDFPYSEAIGATLGAVTVFLSALLGIGSIKYQKLVDNGYVKEED